MDKQYNIHVLRKIWNGSLIIIMNTFLIAAGLLPIFGVVMMTYATFFTDTYEDDPTPIGAMIVLMIIAWFLCLVVTIAIGKFIYHYWEKCSNCGNRFHIHTMGGSAYYQFQCINCGTVRWETHTTENK